MIKKLYFITGNPNKLRELSEILGPYLVAKNVQLESLPLDLPEIQGTPDDIIRDKIRHASKQVDGPVICEDVALDFTALNGLPGAYIKWFLQSIGRDGLPRILEGYSDKSAQAECRVAYMRSTSEEPKVFLGICKGSIVTPKGSTDFGWDPVFLPDGYTQTFAEMPQDEKNKISHRFHALNAFITFIHETEDWI